MNKRILFLFLYITVVSGLFAQEGSVSYDMQLLGGYCGPGEVPFWFRSNQFGSVPPSGASLGLIGAVRKDYNLKRTRKADWGFAAEGRLNIGDPTKFILTEGYGKFKLGIFELKAGRVKEITGLCDTLLTSGSWSVSGNAPGIPKIQLAVPEFRTLPFFGDLFAFKGSYMHGWMGNWHIDDEIVPNTPTYLHQKTLYGRFGKPSWKLKLYAGFNHQVVWGNERNIYLGEYYELNDWQTFLYINTGKKYNNDGIEETHVGNHLGSIDMGMSFEFPGIRLLIYRQNFYDAGALFYLANILDGLNGISFTNKLDNGKRFHWNRFLVEFLYSKNQGGEVWSKSTPSAFENYYNNGYYLTGWSYKGLGLGNPFISPTSSVKESFPIAPDNFFINNRVVALYLGMDGSCANWNFISKFSYSRNYGTYLTSTTGKVHSGTNFPDYGIFPVVGQFSAFLEAKKELKKGIQIGIMTALDTGDLYNDSFGIMGSISKSF